MKRGPDHSIGSPQLAAYEHDVESKIDKANLVLEHAGSIDGEDEYDDVGHPRNTLKRSLQQRCGPADFAFIIGQRRRR
jgi:hypothetical protein